MKRRFRMYIDYTEAEELLRQRAAYVYGLAQDLPRARNVQAPYKRLKREIKYLDYYVKQLVRMREERENG